VTRALEQSNGEKITFYVSYIVRISMRAAETVYLQKLLQKMYPKFHWYMGEVKTGDKILPIQLKIYILILTRLY
jgi:hypothetical protein